MTDTNEGIDPIAADIVTGEHGHERGDGPVLGRPPHTARTLRVCERIEPDREMPDMARFEQSIATRWQALTRPLLLAGGEAMGPSATGEMTALAQLAMAMPWGAPLIADVERQLRIQLAIGRPWVRIEPLLLTGPPGIGKTWLAGRLARVLGLPTATLELGSSSDDRMLSGTARGFTGAQPAWPLVVMAQTHVANPLLVLDELDKAGGSAAHGRPHDALLAMLEPASAATWNDQCLLARCDLSEINWIACGNGVEPIPSALRSRLRVIALPRPAPDHFGAIVASVIAELAARWELDPRTMPDLPPRALRVLRSRFVSDRSVRTLARDTRALIGAMIVDGQGPRRH